MRHLKPVQILGRLYFSWHQPKVSIDGGPPSVRTRGPGRPTFPRHTQRMLGAGTFRFLNETRELSYPGGWNDPGAEKLWLYNLHYFEDLVSAGAKQRAAWHRDLIDRWISDNPPFGGTGWEPYPLSIRIGNWIKWALQDNDFNEKILRSLAIQAEYLCRRVEWRLLGNHVLENAKALILAGIFFEGSRADQWLARGLNIFDAQLDEQVLSDGGHFERSPMYHALVLEGILDLIQVSEHYGMNSKRVEAWRERAGEMTAWLHSMSHPDGEITFFNDAALDVALPPAALMDYARRLNTPVPGHERGEGVSFLEDSGYVRCDRGPWSAVLDVAPVGPDYQPGHAHADTLSFELSMQGRRVLVNSGTSVYELGEERLRQRGTAAHNTVVVDGRNSSEVWSSFRLARRARPFDVSVRGTGEAWRIRAAHDGFRRLPGRVTHRRSWSLTNERFTVEDVLYGTWATAVAYFHFHPDITLTFDGHGGELLWNGKSRVHFRVEEGAGQLTASTYHPAFGLALPSQCLEVSLTDGKARLVLSI